jgi:hypothetical protein
VLARVKKLRQETEQHDADEQRQLIWKNIPCHETNAFDVLEGKVPDPAAD